MTSTSCGRGNCPHQHATLRERPTECFICICKQFEKKRKTSRARPHHHRHIIYPCFISNSALVSDKSPSSLNPRQRRPLAHPSREHSIEVSPGFFFDGVVPIVVGSLISSVSPPTPTTTTTYTRARALSFGIPEARQLLGTNRTGSPETAERRNRTNPENGGEC
jgi:hypothetical protein